MIMSSIQKKKYNSAREKEENVIGKRIVEARKIKGVSCSELSRILLEQGTQIGEDLYEKVDEAIDGVDKRSLRRSIREALEEMDELGISATAVAENTFGIRTTYKSHEKAPENTLIKDAQNAVQKKTEGFFSMLWDKFLDTIENLIMSGISIFSGSEESSAKGGKGL